jgi:uroporphyrinogen-III synthase
MPPGLTGLRVIAFESRRSAEMAELIRNLGIQAPAMREVPLADQKDALAFGEALVAGDVDVLILLTGVGARMLIRTLSTRWSGTEVRAALGRVALVCRGPKPIAALKEIGLTPLLAVPEPNTWRDILSALDGAPSIEGKRVGVQEYGARNEELLAELERRGAFVTSVPTYGWALPEDTGPLRAGIERVAARRVDVAVFTSATQVEHLFIVATEMGQEEGVREGLRSWTVVGSIGPITTAALRERGVAPDVEPERAKMGHLLVEVSRRAGDLMARKRRR